MCSVLLRWGFLDLKSPVHLKGISRLNLSIELRRVHVQSPPFLGAAVAGGTGGALSN